MLMDLFRKSGVNAKVIMHITQPGGILDWRESGLEAATLLPSSEVDADKLSQCYVVDVFPTPQIFAGEITVHALFTRTDGYYCAGISV